MKLNLKSSEQLFTRYFFATLGLQNTNYFAPASAKELFNGYISKVDEVKGAQEIFLQFKQAKFNPNTQSLEIQLDAQQHLNLINVFPANTAYYIFSMVETIEDFMKLQTGISSSLEFLHAYTCIEASCIPLNAKKIGIEPYPFESRTQPKPFIIYPDRQDYKTIKEGSFKASMLSKKLKDKDIGTNLEDLIGSLKQDLVLDQDDENADIWDNACQIGYLKEA